MYALKDKTQRYAINVLGHVTGFKLLTSWGSSVLLVLNSVYIRASWGAFLERFTVEELFKEKLQCSWVRLQAGQKTKRDHLPLSLTLKYLPGNKTVWQSHLQYLPPYSCWGETILSVVTVVSVWLHGKRHPLPKLGLVQFMCGESFSAEVLIIRSRQSN